MIFNSLNDGSIPTVGFATFTNRSGGTISANYPGCITTTSGSADGTQLVAPAANNHIFAGIADQDLADATAGRFQTYGYRDSVRIYAVGTSKTCLPGEAMGTAGASNGVNSTGLKSLTGPVLAMEQVGAAICSPGGFAKGYIKALG